MNPTHLILECTVDDDGDLLGELFIAGEGRHLMLRAWFGPFDSVRDVLAAAVVTLRHHQEHDDDEIARSMWSQFAGPNAERDK